MQPSWKFALIVWLAIYPAITLLQLVIGPYVRELPLPLATLVMTGILVPLAVFVLIPTLVRFLGPTLGLAPPAAPADRDVSPRAGA